MEPVFPFDLTLPRRGQGTLAHALHQQLRSAVLDGRLVAGSTLPSTRDVAAALGVGRNTVVKVYDPPGISSTDVYAHIKNNLEAWIEAAIAIRAKY